jgi:hypothetical protein
MAKTAGLADLIKVLNVKKMVPGVVGGATMGGGTGTLYGALSDPGVDEQGRKKSRLGHAVKSGLIGTGIGAVGGGGVKRLAKFTEKNKGLLDEARVAWKIGRE